MYPEENKINQITPSLLLHLSKQKKETKRKGKYYMSPGRERRGSRRCRAADLASGDRRLGG
jgi:hypothetical protein